VKFTAKNVAKTKEFSMSQPQFEIVSLGENRWVINDQGRTVATVTNQGGIEWLLKSPMESGPLVTKIEKDNHLANTTGLRLAGFVPPSMRVVGGSMAPLQWRLESPGRLWLRSGVGSDDGEFSSVTTAVLTTDDRATRYEWRLDTEFTFHGKQPKHFSTLEFDNVYPGLAGRCFLYAPRKQYRWTLMNDADGVIWRFPHQHTLHYGIKIPDLRFGPGAWAGFFGESTGSPIVVVDECDDEPFWGICDMYYDLHCQVRFAKPIQPGQTLRYRHTIKYLSDAESQKLVDASRAITVTDEDRRSHAAPRLDLGLNRFDASCRVDGEDDCSIFRPRPPVKAWDRDQGHSSKGSIRITNDTAKTTVWTAEPPSLIPSQHVLNIRAMMKTQDVVGQGAYLRVHYLTWVFEPAPPHSEFVQLLTSTPVEGTTPGWVKIEVPPLTVPPEHTDYLIILEFVLDGSGTAWCTDVDVDLQPQPIVTPTLERDSRGSKDVVAVGGKSTVGGVAE